MLLDRTVHVVDADTPVRDHTAALLRAAGYDVETHPSARHFLVRQPDLKPGCILLDIHMPEPDGLEVQRRLLATGRSMPVIVFTGEGDLEFAVRAMRAGALEFLEKPYEDDSLLSAVREAFERLEITEADADRKTAAVTRLALLSPRETQVLQGLMAGSPNKGIAFDLGLSTRTVELYRANMMEKLSVRSLSAAFRLWFDAGLEDTDATSVELLDWVPTRS